MTHRKRQIQLCTSPLPWSLKHALSLFAHLYMTNVQIFHKSNMTKLLLHRTRFCATDHALARKQAEQHLSLQSLPKDHGLTLLRGQLLDLWRSGMQPHDKKEGMRTIFQQPGLGKLAHA